MSFGSLFGLPIMGFEKEINPIRKQLETRKGHQVEIANGKKKSPFSTHLESEIEKCECR